MATLLTESAKAPSAPGRSPEMRAPSADSILPTRGGAVALVLIAIGAPVGIMLGLPELWVPAGFASVAALFSWAMWVYARQPVSIVHDVPERGMSGLPLTTAVSARAPGAKRLMILSIDAGPAGSAPEPVYTEIDPHKPGAAMRVEFPAPSRGLACWKELQAVQLSPFGFTQRRVSFAAPPPTVIWPRMVALDLDGGRSPATEGVTNGRLTQASGAELSSLLREYRDGDDVRHVHWPSSARVGSLLVRQVDESHERTVAIHVEVLGARLEDLALGDEGLDRLSESTQELYDRACSVACSVAMAALSAGLEVEVTTGGGIHLLSSEYPADAFGLIDTLAQARPLDLTAPRTAGERAPDEPNSEAEADGWRSIPNPRTLRIDVIGSVGPAHLSGQAGASNGLITGNERTSTPTGSHGTRPGTAPNTIDVSAADPAAQPPDRSTILCPRLDLLADRWSRWNLQFPGGVTQR